MKDFKRLILLASALLLAACDHDYKEYNTPIAHDDFAQIQIEAQICEHYYQRRDCLRHLKRRIQ